MNTYWRLLGFAKPIEKYAIPYFFYTLFYSLFNTFNFVMIIPILNSLFDPAKQIAQVTSMPAFALNMDYFDRLVNFLLYKIYGPDYSVMNVMLFLSIFIVSSALLSNMFRYLGQWTIENMKIHTLRRLRNAVFDNVMGLHVGYFSNERKGDIISKITSDVTVVQFCITNTLQGAFRATLLSGGPDDLLAVLPAAHGTAHRFDRQTAAQVGQTGAGELRRHDQPAGRGAHRRQSGQGLQRDGVHYR